MLAGGAFDARDRIRSGRSWFAPPCALFYICVAHRQLGSSHPAAPFRAGRSYRLLPDVSFHTHAREEPAVPRTPASSGFFDVGGESRRQKAARPHACDMGRDLRERDPLWAERVQLGRVRLFRFRMRWMRCSLSGVGWEGCCVRMFFT